MINISWNSIDKTGHKFNMLTTIERLPNYKGNSKTYYKCLCDCGNFHYVSNDNLGKNIFVWLCKQTSNITKKRLYW